MPTERFRQWATDFDGRLRFGIPTLPILRRINVSPSIVPLPAHAGSAKFSPDDVAATVALLADVKSGQAIRLTDEPDVKENTARRRAEVMKEQIIASGATLPAGTKLRGHVLTEGDAIEATVNGKKYKRYPRNFAALSVVPDASTDTPEETPPPADPPAPTPPTGRGK